MGDANLSSRYGRTPPSARFRMGHGAKQVAYLDWKASLLANIEQARYDERQGCRLRRPHAAAGAG